MISVITKALLYGGIVSASVGIMFRLDNPIIAAVIWVAAGVLCGAAEWFGAKERTRKSTERENAVSNHFSELSELIRELAEEEQKSRDCLDALNDSIKEYLDGCTDKLCGALDKNNAAARVGFESTSKHLSAIKKEIAVSAEKLTEGTLQAAETLGGKLDKGFECIGSALDNSVKITDISLNALSEKIAEIGDVFEKHTDESGKKIDGIMKSIGELNDLVKTVSAKLQAKDWGDEMIEEISEINEAMKKIRGDVLKCNDSIPTLTTEISEFNEHYRNSLNAMSNEIKSVVKNISDNYKMLKQLSDRYA